MSLTSQRLHVLACLKANADRGRVNKGLSVKAGESYLATIVWRATETLALQAEIGAIFMIAWIKINRIKILLIREVLDRSAIIRDLYVYIIATGNKRQRTKIISTGLKAKFTIK